MTLCVFVPKHRFIRCCRDFNRGYQDEIEPWAYCIRNPDPENRPRCYPAEALKRAKRGYMKRCPWPYGHRLTEI